MADRYPFIYATIGVHPHDASKATPETWARLRELATHPKVLAVGEIGLDYHYDFSPRDVQRAVFEQQLQRSPRKRSASPSSSTPAKPGTTRSPCCAPTGTAAASCTASPAMKTQARQALDLGFHLSFGGVLTFPKAENVRQAARIAPAERLLIETDCPYLAPVPHRGKRNEPAFVVETARRLAEVRGVSPEAIAETTTANFEQLLFAGGTASR
jgi:TatD DNase family protein